MKYVLSVLQVCHEEQRKAIDQELGSLYDIKYATPMTGRSNLIWPQPRTSSGREGTFWMRR